jgi:hypothetical protein
VFIPAIVLTSASFADECEPDAILVEDATFVDGSCVIPWDSSSCVYDCYADAAEARPMPYQNGAWFNCGPGSSAAMLRLRADNGSQDRAVFWYDEDGQILGVTGGSSNFYCCEEQQAFPDTFVTYGAPMQTCYAPIPYRIPEMELAGECLAPPGSCSAVGTSGLAGFLSLFCALMLLGRRERV